MSKRDEDDYQRSPVARALMNAGYKRSQRVWLTPEQYTAVLTMAHENEAHVQRIKDRARAEAFGKGGNA